MSAASYIVWEDVPKDDDEAKRIWEIAEEVFDFDIESLERDEGWRCYILRIWRPITLGELLQFKNMAGATNIEIWGYGEHKTAIKFYIGGATQ